MATTEESTNLNELLEDALEDLLLDKEDEDDDQKGHHDANEQAGRPNIDESLRKITQNVVSAATTTTTTTTTRASTSSGSRNNSNLGEEFARSSSSSATGTKVLDEEEMNRFFASIMEKLKTELPKMEPSEAQARLNESVPQIFDLMQNLLSKELLYPALKDLEPKFDEWLKNNMATLSKDDRRRFKKQRSKIHDIIDVFDDESLEDQERFEKNLELMEQMQSLGAPPEDLTVPDGMSKCSIM